jgi:hypothetical protein
VETEALDWVIIYPGLPSKSILTTQPCPFHLLSGQPGAFSSTMHVPQSFLPLRSPEFICIVGARCLFWACKFMYIYTCALERPGFPGNLQQEAGTRELPHRDFLVAPAKLGTPEQFRCHIHIYVHLAHKC